MSLQPTTYSPDKLNKITVQLDSMRKQVNKGLTHIAAIDSGLNHIVGLALDVLNSQEQVVAHFIEEERSLKPRDVKVIDSMMTSKINDLREDYLTNYKSLLKARDDYMENGQAIRLTPDVRQKLTESFSLDLDSKLKRFGEAFSVDASTNLEALQAKLKAEIQKQTIVLDRIFDAKTLLTKKILESQATPEVKQLLTARKKLISDAGNNNNYQPADIWEACQTGATDFLKQQIANIGLFQFKYTFINQKNEIGFTPLHLAAFNGHVETLSLLLANKADPMIPDANGYLALHWAAKNGHLEVGKELLNHKAPVNAKGEYGRMPLHMAVFNGHILLTKLFLDYGAPINAQTEPHGTTPLHDAVLQGKIEMVLTLLDSTRLDVNIKDNAGHTPFFYAIADGCLEIALLIASHQSWTYCQNAADPNHIDQLLKLKPKQNPDEINQFLIRLRLKE